jgi:GNAT superfamily N-acetyltransferase
MGIAVGKIHFAVEQFKAVIDEARPLLRRHWEEIAKNKELLKLNPDMEMYDRIGENLLLITARNDGALVGYFVWFLIKHPHYRHVSVAEEDLHFLLPEYRRGLTGYKLMKAACTAAFDCGANLLVSREKIGHEHPAIMKRLGFVPTDIVYTRGV